MKYLHSDHGYMKFGTICSFIFFKPSMRAEYNVLKGNKRQNRPFNLSHQTRGTWLVSYQSGLAVDENIHSFNWLKLV